MGYIAIVLILVAVIVILAARLLILRREIDRISRDLCELNTDAAHGKLTVTILHKRLETLCQEINISIDINNKARINAEVHERELRVQIANISHDLRTPLTAILGYISMMKNAQEKTQDYLGIIENRAKALKNLIEQFYELSIIDDSHAELEMQSVDITAALTDCLLGNYALFEEKKIQFKNHLPDHAINVISNAKALERIFQNLIQNTLKFAKSSVSIALTDEGTYCLFVISNDAQNLTKSDIAHMFERFYTDDKSRTTGNTGLGLYIVKRLLGKTQGSIKSVDLEDGWFTLKVSFKKL